LLLATFVAYCLQGNETTPVTFQCQAKSVLVLMV
jgi:hypothetical protein